MKASERRGRQTRRKTGMRTVTDRKFTELFGDSCEPCFTMSEYNVCTSAAAAAFSLASGATSLWPTIWNEGSGRLLSASECDPPEVTVEFCPTSVADETPGESVPTSSSFRCSSSLLPVEIKSLIHIPQWCPADTQIKTPTVENPKLSTILPLKPGAVQIIARQ